MLTPIDFSRLSGALASQIYWLELALVLACIAFAWAIDRRLEVGGTEEDEEEED